ncbi:MAG: hypothetical protein JWO54_371 [Candidatus Saccharibacteria bacterium]|nr:hypothetical protein [Candidatus Saccharibacteria bacterium]
MPNNKTITINGRAYDAVTGLPISERVYDQVSRVSNANKVAAKKAEAEAKPKPAPKPAVKRDAATAATAVHSQTQRSQTLLRRATKKPAAAAKRPTTGRHMDMARSTSVSKFAPHPVVSETPKPKAPVTPDKAPQVHPVAAKAVARSSAAKAVAAKPATAKQVKDTAIANALAAPKQKPAKADKMTNKLRGRVFIVIGIILAVALGLYAVYHFVPSVSVSIASAQSGVKASYPEYVPDGFSLNHPVTYSDGEVVLKFKSNSNENSYTITQTRSSWDSSAVLDNVVRPDAGENYITTKERGLTVYSYGNNAAWVNGGVLYVISSNNAPLSGEQIRHIATSL